MPKTIIIAAARFFFAVVFIFSGFVKAVDPLGSTYKFQDFFVAFGVEWLFPAALPLAIFLSTLEFTVGVAFFFRLHMRFFAPVGLVLMAVFTPATIYIALTDPVAHCGCFGDAFVISNQATAFKNLLLLAAAVIVFLSRDRLPSPLSDKNSWSAVFFAAALAVLLSVYGLRHLPVIDFRAWKAGNNIAELMTSPEPSGRIDLVFENRETGEIRTYPADDYPWDDPEWSDLWQYKTRKEKEVKSAVESPLANFSIVDKSGRDMTASIISDTERLLLVAAYDLNTTSSLAFDARITPLVAKAEKHGYQLVVLTASLPDDIKKFKHRHQADYPFYQADEREIKTIVRSNPGLVLMKNGVVTAKWAWRDIPEFEEIKSRYHQF